MEILPEEYYVSNKPWISYLHIRRYSLDFVRRLRIIFLCLPFFFYRQNVIALKRFILKTIIFSSLLVKMQQRLPTTVAIVDSWHESVIPTNYRSIIVVFFAGNHFEASSRPFPLFSPRLCRSICPAVTPSKARNPEKRLPDELAAAFSAASHQGVIVPGIPCSLAC